MCEHEEITAGSRGRRVGRAVAGVCIFLAFLLLLGAATQFLWNRLMPPIFRLGSITYFQGVGLLLLFRILFGRIGQSRDHAGYLTGKYGFLNVKGRNRVLEKTIRKTDAGSSQSS